MDPLASPSDHTSQTENTEDNETEQYDAADRCEEVLPGRGLVFTPRLRGQLGGSRQPHASQERSDVAVRCRDCGTWSRTRLRSVMSACCPRGFPPMNVSVAVTTDHLTLRHFRVELLEREPRGVPVANLEELVGRLAMVKVQGCQPRLPAELTALPFLEPPDLLEAPLSTALRQTPRPARNPRTPGSAGSAWPCRCQ
jgi:hypothetical protein